MPFWSKHSGQHILVNTFWSKHSGQYILVNTFWSIHSGQYILVNTFWSINSGHYILVITFWSIILYLKVILIDVILISVILINDHLWSMPFKLVSFWSKYVNVNDYYLSFDKVVERIKSPEKLRFNKIKCHWMQCFQVSISPTFYVQLLHQNPFAKKVQTQIIST